MDWPIYPPPPWAISAQLVYRVGLLIISRFLPVRGSRAVFRFGFFFPPAILLIIFTMCFPLPFAGEQRRRRLGPVERPVGGTVLPAERALYRSVVHEGQQTFVRRTVSGAGQREK